MRLMTWRALSNSPYEAAPEAPAPKASEAPSEASAAPEASEAPSEASEAPAASEAPPKGWRSEAIINKEAPPAPAEETHARAREARARAAIEVAGAPEVGRCRLKRSHPC